MLLATPLTPVPSSLLGNSLAVALIALIHQQLFTFMTGSATLVVISEGIAMARNDPRHERYAGGLLKAMAWVFSGGSAVPIVFVIFVLTGFWGTFFVALTRITFWVFVLEAGFFLAEIILLYSVYANWERLRAYRRVRLGLLILLNVVLFWQMFLIDVVASYMLTPNGGDTNQLAQVLNPTDLPLTIHRTIGNIAYAGGLTAAFAAFKYLRLMREERRERAVALAPAPSVGAMHASLYRGQEAETTGDARNEDRRFYDFLGTWGVLWAVGLTLFQPYVGYSYAKEIQLHSYPAWYRMMFGDLSTVFLLQITLLGLIFVFGTVYFLRRRIASGARRLLSQRIAIGLLIIATVLAAMPARFAWTDTDIAPGLHKPWWQGGLENPIGTMIPNKIIALIVMMLAGLWALTGYLRARSRGELLWGDAGRGTQRLLLATTLTIALIMPVMGVIREHSRQPYLIYGELTLQGQKQVPSQTGSLGQSSNRSSP